MNFEITTSEDFKTINWSGGTSTQLYIYPPTSDYQKRDFAFRLSTATVEVEKSDFTSLPGISRKIMILDGAIEIIHENRYSKKLGKFDTDSFKGDWKTSSVGKCIDFNLMTRGTASGEILALSIKKNKATTISIDRKADYLILYVFSGEISLTINQETHQLQQGNLLVITQFDSSNLKLTGSKDSEVILSEITSQDSI
ncbi:HutD family protein [Labilibaculum sp. K2S]|uniref:HutD/Ves family protein n=1 Tax=Labilibaculum sp. K2S TaxID=3056386 RepID=UPI0025A406EB|nr:HutD family protein [Labilibaculum sp. K2S]MDM8161011.1 HutD family protein [Labilibaculum sp. K2S]